jgi:hypothetical protein
MRPLSWDATSDLLLLRLLSRFLAALLATLSRILLLLTGLLVLAALLAALIWIAHGFSSFEWINAGGQSPVEHLVPFWPSYI